MNKILRELKEHIPFAMLATVIALILVVVWYVLSKTTFTAYTETTFELFHSAHIFFSGIASAAMFYKYKDKFFQALAVGIFSTLTICILSDIIFPYLGGLLLGFDMHFHLSLIEEPLLIFGAVIIGSLIGIKKKVTKLPHFFHVFLTTFASLLYLVAFGASLSVIAAIGIFAIVAFSVVIPCCLSDIVLPLTFVKR